MTLIEFFAASHIDNLAACLRLRPDSMVMVGNAEQMHEAAKQYQKLLKKRGMSTKITTCDVRRMDLEDMIAALKKVIAEAKDCVIELSGGDGCATMAVGAVLAQLPKEARQHVRVEKADFETGTVYDCVHDQRKVHEKAPELTVKELIELHGGTFDPDGYQPPKDCSAKDLEGLWKVVSEDPKWWNDTLRTLAEFEKRAASKMQVELPLWQLQGSIHDFQEKEKAVRALLEKLHHCGAIENRSHQDTLSYTYTSPLMRYCTQKAGNVLEVKVLLEGREVLEKGAPYFNDCQMSVRIDWDGAAHESAKGAPDTRNEIDVLLMHGTTPLFVSCKNGKIEEEELYKLHTVAGYFGGPYAKKMLIATDMDQMKPAAKRAFVRRAWDMKIYPVEDADALSDSQWREIFKEAMQ